MQKINPLFRFCIYFLLSYFLLTVLAAAPVFKASYSEAFQRTGQSFYGTLGKQGITNFKPNPRKASKADIVIKLTQKDIYEEAMAAGKVENVPMSLIPLDTWYFSLLPTIFLLALVFASPIAFMQKIWAVLLSMMIMHLYIGFKLWVRLMEVYNKNEILTAVNYGPFGDKLMTSLNFILNTHIVPTIIAPVLIWMLVSFKKDDYLKFLNLK